MGAAGIIKMSEDPLRTGYTLIALLASWDVLRNYIRQHNDNTGSFIQKNKKTQAKRLT